MVAAAAFVSRGWLFLCGAFCVVSIADLQPSLLLPAMRLPRRCHLLRLELGLVADGASAYIGHPWFESMP